MNSSAVGGRSMGTAGPGRSIRAASARRAGRCSASTAASPECSAAEWIDRIIDLENATVEGVMARTPDGGDMFEVVRFHSPSAGAQEPAPAANRPGFRHVAFTVDDVRGVLDRVREAGWETVGRSSTTFLLCYVRGPEGLIVELAERLDGAPG